MDISKSRSRRQGVPLDCKPLNCMSFPVEDSDKYSSQSNEEAENIPPKLTQSSAKKGKKLFKKPSAMTALLSPAKQVQCSILFVRHIL